MSGRVLFTVAVLAVFAAAIVYTALCARAEARTAALGAADSQRVAVTDEAIARLLDEAADVPTAA